MGRLDGHLDCRLLRRPRAVRVTPVVRSDSRGAPTLRAGMSRSSSPYGVRVGYGVEMLPYLGERLDGGHLGSTISTQSVPITVVGIHTTASLQASDCSLTAMARDGIRVRWVF